MLWGKLGGEDEEELPENNWPQTLFSTLSLTQTNDLNPKSKENPEISISPTQKLFLLKLCQYVGKNIQRLKLSNKSHYQDPEINFGERKI